MNSRPSLMMLPQLGAGGGVPSPRKLRPDSTRMAHANPKVTCTTNGAIVCGAIWLARMRRSLAPMTRAASTKSMVLTSITEARTTRTIRGVYMMIIARTTLPSDWPSAAITMMPMIRPGKFNNASPMRLITVSASR